MRTQRTGPVTGPEIVFATPRQVRLERGSPPAPDPNESASDRLFAEMVRAGIRAGGDRELTGLEALELAREQHPDVYNAATRPYRDGVPDDQGDVESFMKVAGEIQLQENVPMHVAFAMAKDRRPEAWKKVTGSYGQPASRGSTAL